MRALVMVGGLLGLVACQEEGAGGKESGEIGEDTAAGGGELENWRASGTGTAYFTDGASDGSLFRLSLSRALPPRDGYAYYGFVGASGGEVIAVGEISVNGEDVDFQADVGMNAIMEGLSHFEAWHTNGSGDAPEGDPVWAGDVDTTVYDVIQRLLIANPDTPTGEGSLRALESQVEYLGAEAQAAADGGLTIGELQLIGEKIGNALEDPPVDSNDDGKDDVFPDTLAIEGDDTKGDDGYVEIIQADFQAVALALDLRDPKAVAIRELIDDAYDGLDFTDYTVKTFAVPGARSTGNTDTASVAESFLDGVAEDMANCLTGYDADGDGVIDPQVEVGIEWTIDRVSYMAQMPVNAVN
jgi:hypothetical protein